MATDADLSITVNPPAELLVEPLEGFNVEIAGELVAATFEMTPDSPAAELAIALNPVVFFDAGATVEMVVAMGDASTSWIFNHNLGFRPAITILSPGGVEIDAGVVHTSVNQAVISFTEPYYGRAIAR